MRPVLRLLTALVLLAPAMLAGLVVAPSASALSGYQSEEALKNATDDIRDTFILDPGVGRLLSRQRVFAQADYYARHGFDRNFLWYAPEVQRTVSGDTYWAGCEPVPRSSPTPCPDSSLITPARTVGAFFGGATTLSLFEFEGSFIARVCGNWSPKSTGRTPIPTIAGSKFDDRNRDGVRQGDEPPLDCPPRTDVGVTTSCTVSGTVVNTGDYGPARTDLAFALSAPSDCVVDATSPTALDDVPVGLTAGVPVSATFAVTCAQRSYHPMTGSIEAHVDHLHLEDVGPGNEQASGNDVVEVFQAGSLKVDRLSVSCTERESNTTASACTVTATTSTGGPADDVQALAQLGLIVEPDCVATSVGGAQFTLVLEIGSPQVVATTWQVTCTRPQRHAVTGTASLAVNEPHAEAPSVSAEARWVPGDAKPRSLPSSINIGKQGVVPFALLSTATFDALRDVNRSSLTVGATGTEAVPTCAPTGEDVNDDGRVDLICQASAQSLGLTCDSKLLVVLGRLTDGRPFRSEDTVNIVGCTRT